MGKIVIIVLLLIVCVAIAVSRSDKEKEEIREWAKTKGLSVSKIEIHYTAIGTTFYYVQKNCNIYEVDMSNGEKWWVRIGVFSNDYEKDI